MGNYTGYRISLRLIPSTPDGVVQTLLDVVRGNEPRHPVPNHAFFERGLWENLFAGGSDGSTGGSNYFIFIQDNQGNVLKPSVMARARLGRGKTNTWEVEAYGSTKGFASHFASLMDWLAPWIELQPFPVLVTQYEEDTCVPLPADPNEEVIGFGFSPEYGALARVVGLDGEGLWNGTVVGQLDGLVLPDLVGDEVLNRKHVAVAA